MLLAGCVKEPKGSSSVPLGSQQALTSDKRDSDAKGAPVPTNVARAPSEVVARVNNMPITMEQLQGPLVEAYGLQILLHLAQLEVCRQKAAGAGVTIAQKDVDDERQRTLESLFRDAVNVETMKGTAQEKEAFRQREYQRLLEMFLTNQRISRPEFELANRTNAYLRKLAEQGVREQITEDHLREGFNVMYGEKVRVRHIQLNDMREAIKAKARLNEGEAFEKVAQEISRDERTKNLGGLVQRPFTRNDPMWPEAFKEATFALEPNEISDPVLSGDTVHLIKLEQQIPPSTAVKYESHRDIVREELIKGLILVRMSQFREQVQNEARKTLEIHDPVLSRRYKDEVERLNNQANADPEVVRHQMEMDQKMRATTQPATEGDRPPATRPAQ